MPFVGIPIVLDEWLDIPGGQQCNISAAKAIGIIPFEGSGQDPVPPTDSLLAWYKADAQPYNDNDRVTSMIDSGPNGFHLDGGGSGPLLKTNVLNGKPVFRYDIFRTNTISMGPINPPGFTTALVTRRTILNPSFTGQALCPASPLLYRVLSTDVAPSSMQWTSSGFGSDANITVPLGNWEVITSSFEDAEGIPRLRTNFLRNDGSSVPVSSSINSLFVQYWPDGEIAEVIMYSKKLTLDELFLLRAYLSQKYAISIAS